MVSHRDGLHVRYARFQHAALVGTSLASVQVTEVHFDSGNSIGEFGEKTLDGLGDACCGITGEADTIIVIDLYLHASFLRGR
jgi:hypothetical protein